MREGDVPFAPRFGRDLWHARVGEYPPVEKLHDVEWGADDVHILTEDDGLGYWHLPICGGRWVCVVLVQGAEHGVLALDLVRGLGEELACGLLAEHEAFLATCTNDMLVYKYRNKDIERATHLASVRKYVGLDYSPNLIRSDANIIC